MWRKLKPAILEKLLAYLYLFLLPTQLGRHFFFDFSYFVGVRSTFLALVIYSTDLIFLALIALFIFNRKKYILNNKLKISKIWWVIIVFLVMNFFESISYARWGYQMIRYLELIGVFFIFSKISFDRKKVVWILISATLIQLFLVMYQIDTGRSIQGIAWFLGERMFDSSYPGIAKVYLWGVEKVRGYGTFSHPNSLGGFFLMWFVFYFTQTKKLLKSELLLLVISGVLVLLSFSKIAIIVLLLLLIGQTMSKGFECFICRTAKIMTFFAIMTIFLMASHDEQGMEKRVFWAFQAIEVIKSHPIFGVGMGNYLLSVGSLGWKIPFVETLIQPVHNIFLLFFAEVGLVGLGLITLMIGKLYQITPEKKRFLILILTIGFLGMWDHYILTLHQNLVLVGVILGLIQNENQNQ